jgi:Protein of unknown function (DUF2567)
MTAASPPPAPQPPVVDSLEAWGQPVSRPPRQRTGAFHRGDLLDAVIVLSAVALVGIPLAWLWSSLAPPQVSVLQADGVLGALPPESQHRFDDLALFVLLGTAVGVLSGAAAWLLRQRRGPLALLGLAAGSLLAAWLAMRIGLSFADGRYADAIRTARPDSVVRAGPRLESAWALIAQPLAAVLTYGVAAATNSLDDLGSGRS